MTWIALLQRVTGEAQLGLHPEGQAGGAAAVQQGLPGVVLGEDEAEVAGIDAALLLAHAGRIGALDHELVAAQIKDQGIGAPAFGHATEALDRPALGGVQVDGGDGEVELELVHGR